MFTYIKLKNFMSFKDVEVDFRSGSKGAKKFISIYGENGSGKSNFVNAINLLYKSADSFRTLGVDEKIKELVSGKEFPEDLLEFLINDVNILKYVKTCRMLECEEDTSVEYGFRYKGYEGYYSFSFTDRFVHEKLYYYTGKQRGVLFEVNCAEDGTITPEFSAKIFQNKKVQEELRDELDKYWGKHTLLSILTKERREKNEQYIKTNYLKYLFYIIDMLEDTAIHYNSTSLIGYEIDAREPKNLLQNLKEGKINLAEEELLNRSERILRDFFTQAYADIKDVFYERRVEETEIYYKLYVKKMIGEKVRTVDFGRESGGTQKILEIVRALLGAFCGVTVVYDEIDNGIHDLLLKNIIMSMMDDITGQLIITTHNTFLLESIDIKSAYIINVDYQGNKEIKSLDKYPRIQGTNNPRRMYLKGLFGGVPMTDTLDYEAILSELVDDTDVEGGE
ncbi:MAG: AAA family ATPase [Lachnospiraceae bacterium]|nr:AAA family ATPase [Lachnospiraceae bacterium]MBO5176754.1 AAA family ATPase [Lachnospiraceae bacterium]